MCKDCGNKNVCPFKESYEFLCQPLVDAIDESLGKDDIFTMELKCNYKNKELPYKVDNTDFVNPELEEELYKILENE